MGGGGGRRSIGRGASGSTFSSHVIMCYLFRKISIVPSATAANHVQQQQLYSTSDRLVLVFNDDPSRHPPPPFALWRTRKYYVANKRAPSILSQSVSANFTVPRKRGENTFNSPLQCIPMS